MLSNRFFFMPFSGLAGKSVRLMSTNVSDAKFVLKKEVNNNGLLILNRPKVLNAANMEMLQDLTATLNEWKDTKSVIIVRGNGDKAFCAGGDVRTMAEKGAKYGIKLAKIEYSMDYLISQLKVPYIALLNGITMGGGVGTAIYGKYRIATEKTVFAMPETTIGLFPDIGSSYYLPRLQGRLGYYLGLTGSRLFGQDVLHAGIATHYCDSAKMPKLENTLLELKNANDVEAVINDFCSKNNTEFSFADRMEQINECFNAKSVEEILEKLAKDNSDWAKETIKILRAVSPTSLKVTLQQLSLGANLTLDECLQMEYVLMNHFLNNSDFHEGVRALLVSKDKTPKWNPKTIEDVSVERVLSFFEPLQNNDKLPI